MDLPQNFVAITFAIGTTMFMGITSKKKFRIEPEYKNLGRKLRVLREKRGLTQAQVAKLFSISRPSIVNIENGKQRVLYHNALRYVDKLVNAKVKRDKVK